MGNRNAFINVAVEWISKIIPGSDYPNVLRQQLESLSDEAFERYVQHLEKTGDSLPIVVPNYGKIKIDVRRNLEVAKELGYDFFQHLYLTDDKTGLTYKTPIKYLVLRLPIRRQVQTLENKISIPETNRSVDDRSGQPSGPSKGASITFPEVQVMRSQGAYRALEETLKYRGGDTKGFQLMNKMIMETGGVSLDALAYYGTKVKSTETLGTFLLAAHLDNNL